MTARRSRRALDRPRSMWAGPALLALLALLALAAAGMFWNRNRDQVPPDLRELYLERGRQLLLAGDWQRSLAYLSEVYSGAEADAGVRFLVARAMAPLRGVRSEGIGNVTLAAGRSKNAWLSADLSHDWTRIVAVDASGEAAIFNPYDGRRLVGLADIPPDLALVRFSPDGERIAGAHTSGRFSLWRGDTGELVLSRKPGQAPEAGAAGGRCGAGPAMAFFAGGRRLITATSAGAVRIWDTAGGASLASFEIGSGGAFAFRPDGRRLVSVADHVAMIWNLETGKPIVSLDLPRDAEVHSLAYSPDGLHILTAGEPPEVRLFDAANGELEALLLRLSATGGMSGHGGFICHAVFSPGSSLILTTGDDRTARIWDAERGRLLAALPLPASEVIDAEYGPRSMGFATVHADGTVNLRSPALETENPAEIRRLRKCFVPWRLVSGRLLPATPDPRACRRIRATPEEDHEEIAAVDLPDPKPPVSSRPPPLPIVLKTTVSGRVVDLEGTPIPGAEIRLWSEGTALRTFRHDDAVLSASFSPDGRRLLTACRDGTARIWAMATEQPLGEPMRHDGAVSSAAFSPDGRRVVTASADGTARIWGLSPSEPLRHGAAVRSAAFSPDSRRLATASADGTIRLWQAATGQPLGKPLDEPRHGAAATSVAFSPDGRRLVTASQEAARVWETASGKSLATPMRHPGVRSASFSPDGRRVVTASWDGTVRLWWVAAGPRDDPGARMPRGDPGARIQRGDPGARIPRDGPPSGTLLDHGSLTAAFSPDGQRLATAGWDGVARVWQLSDQMDKVVGRHRAPVYSAAFSPDGRWLVTASEDGTARVWSTQVWSTQVWSTQSRSTQSRGEASLARGPDAESLEALLPPVATTDRKGKVRFEIDRARRPVLLVSRAGYRTPAAYLLPFARENTAFTAELSHPPAGGQTINRSRIRELPAEPAAAPESYILLRNADLVETLRSFATLADLNLVFAPGIEGTINADFPDVPLVQAFEEILRIHDLAYVVCCARYDPPTPPKGTTSFDQQVSIAPPMVMGPFAPRILGLIVPRDGRTLAPESPALKELVGFSPRPSPVPDAPLHPPGVSGEKSLEATAAEDDIAEGDIFQGDIFQGDIDRFPGELIDMSLRNADLVEVLRSFATISDLHWAIDADVAGTLSVEIRGLPWDQVLHAILRLHDLRLEVSGSSVRIRRRDRESGR